MSKPMENIAVVGTGIAGMAAAWFLREKANITLYEKNSYAGGHTNTVVIQEKSRQVPVDTGFMVYNEVTYPNLVRLFKVLGVPSKPAPMSFSVQHEPTQIEYAGSNLNQLFAQRRNLLRPSHYRMIGDILNFNKSAAEVVENESGFEHYSLGQYIREKGYSDAFSDRYLLPMASAIWSTPPGKMLEFPAITLIRFFKNHGLLGHKSHFQWRTVDGGSRVYRDIILRHFGDQVHCSRAARVISRSDKGVQITDVHGHKETHDKVIVATHADEALQLLDRPSDREKRMLSKFSYENNPVILHTDSTPMPRRRRTWASWNYRLARDGEGNVIPTTVYWMNNLQGVSDSVDYFVSVKDPGLVNPDKIIASFDYTHPVFTRAAIGAQAELPRLNESGPVYFCGSYFRYGFHEDALTSAIDVAEKILGKEVWS